MAPQSHRCVCCSALSEVDPVLTKAQVAEGNPCGTALPLLQRTITPPPPPPPQRLRLRQRLQKGITLLRTRFHTCTGLPALYIQASFSAILNKETWRHSYPAQPWLNEIYTFHLYFKPPSHHRWKKQHMHPIAHTCLADCPTSMLDRTDTINPYFSKSPAQGSFLTTWHHGGGGVRGPPPPPRDPTPQKRLGQISSRTSGRSKIFSDAFGAN